ncbi:MAG: toll/interleukin-1 receptor domain-containing protein [Rubrivivax sp.]
MTAVPGHEVFVSYAHADNGVPVGASVQHGWVTALASNLNEGPNVLKKRLFIDHELQPGDNFSSELLTKVERSSLLVILLSQNYIDSAWCGQELAHFIRTHSTDPDKPADVYVVELFPYERLTAVPLDIQLLRKQLIHAKFWYQRRDAFEPSLAGYPSARECEPDGREHYWNVLNELRVALDTRLRFLRTQTAPLATASRPQDLEILPPPPHLRDPLGTVLLADVTDDLEAQRNAVRIALVSEGVVVLPQGDYVGFTPPEFEAAIAQDLQRASLFVQLLSLTPGRKGRGFELPLPQLQYRHARSAKLPILQWCERLPTAEQIVDEAHARLFQTETLRAMHLAEFKTTIIERLHDEKASRQQRAAAPAGPDQPAFPPHKWQIFVDDLASEAELSEQLRAVIREHACAVRSLPSGAPLGNNGIDIKELLRPCRAGITIYTDRSKYATAYNRLVYFLNQVAEGGLPLARWGVYLQHGTVASEFGIESDEVVPINEHGLADFLRGL